jgi:hypothetical protein
MSTAEEIEVSEWAFELADPADRIHFMPAWFPGNYLGVEQSIYRIADRDWEDYRGGEWDFWVVTADDGERAPLITLSSDEPKFKVHSALNYYEGEMSPFAASVALNLVLFNNYGWMLYGKRMEDESIKYFDYYKTLMRWVYSDNQDALLKEEITEISKYTD